MVRLRILSVSYFPRARLRGYAHMARHPTHSSSPTPPAGSDTTNIRQQNLLCSVIALFEVASAHPSPSPSLHLLLVSSTAAQLPPGGGDMNEFAGKRDFGPLARARFVGADAWRRALRLAPRDTLSSVCSMVRPTRTKWRNFMRMYGRAKTRSWNVAMPSAPSF